MSAVLLSTGAGNGAGDHLHQVQAMREGCAGREFVFCDAKGGPLRKSNVRRVFNRLLKEAGVPDIRFHDLRHTAATLLLSQNVHSKIVQARLGHSKIPVTLDTYRHVIEGDGRPGGRRDGRGPGNRMLVIWP